MRHPLNKLQQQALEKVRERFIYERVQGYIDRDGVRHDPVRAEEADRQWTEDIGQWEAVLFDPDVISRLNLANDEPIPAEFITPSPSSKTA